MLLLQRAAALVLSLAPAAGLVAQTFQPPKGWLELPAAVERGATVRLFVAPQALSGKGENKHAPLLRVMHFASGGDAKADVVDGLPRTTPFRSLEDFAVRGIGAKDVVKEARKVAGGDGQRISAKDVPGDRALIGQTLPLANGEIAVCLEVLANHADRVGKELEPVFAAFESKDPPPAPRPTPPWLADAEWNSKDAAARTAARRKWADEVVAATNKSPEPGWKVSKAKFWTVLSTADAAFTKKATTAAEVAREWFAKKLPELTKDAPLPAVLRIFDSVDQYTAWLTTRNDSREYDAARRELHLVNDRDLGASAGQGQTLRAVLWQIVDDFDPFALPAMPRWLDNGCWEFLRSSKFDGKKFEFFAGDVEKGRIDYYKQKDQAMPNLWDLIQEHSQPSPKEGAAENVWGYTPECSRLMRWFWMHDGQKAFEKPTLVADYFRALGTAYTKIGRDPTADVPTVGLSEAEAKERNTRFYKWRDSLLVAINDIAVPLPIETWKSINGKWLEFNKNFK